jgi:hypothetical protein
VNDRNDEEEAPEFLDELDEWARMTPAERFTESAKLWEIYLALGGSFDPEPDSQSPFDCEELQRAVPRDGRPGVRLVRRGGIHPRP